MTRPRSWLCLLAALAVCAGCDSKVEPPPEPRTDTSEPAPGLSPSAAAETERLLAAIRADDPEAVRQLIREGVNVNGPGAYGRTPLHVAAGEGNRPMVELLVAKKANVLAADARGSTPLHLAAAKGSQPVVEYLLAHRADARARDKAGRTPLHLA
ncbi:MAG TPA: ankyrin repeat domain-containing protein, partial [Phycisphaerae bacterium]|nr:ankyrin repeat domain-containing protein [Phycisphaerae bacterium]